VWNQLSLKIELNDNYQDKFRGAFVGAAIGDALGFITEFIRNEREIKIKYNLDKLDKFVAWEKITTYLRKGQYINLSLPAGTYSDDTQLTLATARSIESSGSFNPDTFAKFELPLWLEYELGGGSGTKAAARNLRNENINWHNNFYHTNYNTYVNGGGNGAAMRILPIVLVNHRELSKQYLDIWRNTIITHGHPKGLIGAILLADSIRLIIENPLKKSDWLEQLIESCTHYPNLTKLWSQEKCFVNWEQQWNQVTQQKYQEVWNATCEECLEKLKLVYSDFDKTSLNVNLQKLGCYQPETKGAGDSTVIAAILFVCRLTNFYAKSDGKELEDTIISIANTIGIDTDTIAYFAGAMIGAQYGFEAISNKFKKKVQDYGYLLKIADWCHQVYLKPSSVDKIFHYPYSSDSQKLSSFVSDISRYITKDQIINLPVFGNAKIVHNVDITPRGLNKRLLWLRLELDFGQTLYIKAQVSDVSSSVSQRLFSPQGEYIVNYLPVLDEFKDSVEKSNFDSEVIVNILKHIKFERKDRAIYNAFSTWLWATLPSSTEKR